jgi:site-specific DNA-methyltransferase (adenine-specific)
MEIRKEMIDLRLGDCIDALKTLEDNSVDSIVTDPPYGLSFMGKKWDYDVPSVDIWSECLRVLKPGGHLLSFGGSRTYHRMAVAIEDAGFDIRDQIMWVYGSGFPKSHNIGNKLEDWKGWGTALKPAHEPICMARKPLSEKTIVKNVLKHGTGGINIDDCRIGNEIISSGKSKVVGGGQLNGANTRVDVEETFNEGRFPANIMFDEEAGKILDEQSVKASRFFYCPKVSKTERNAGLDDFEDRPSQLNSGGIGRKTSVEKRLETNGENAPTTKNHHPTVKPIKLMEYLITLVTPKGGIVLEPFMGSGSTGIAAKNLGMSFIGIEREEEYFEIAKQRINNN